MAAHSVLYQLHKKLNEKKDKEALEEAFRSDIYVLFFKTRLNVS